LEFPKEWIRSPKKEASVELGAKVIEELTEAAANKQVIDEKTL
jgi:hypothetical protein